jgi:hypothetical protein
MMTRGAIVGVLLALGAVSQVSATVVFGPDDFNSGVAINWTSLSYPLGVDTTPSGENFLGIAGDGSNFGLSSGTVNLTVGALVPHTDAVVRFRLYVIRTMDGVEPFSVSTDGIDRINPDATFSNLGNSSCTNNTSPGCTSIGAHNAPPGTIGPTVAALGFPPLNNGAVGDTFYDITLTFPHTAPALVVAFSYTGLQELNDESWGLDKVTVEIRGDIQAAVPEPATLGLVGVGLAAFVGALRRRRS